MENPDRSQGQDAYLRIVDDIRDGILKPGDRLTETDLAARFEMSRTPIREAIRLLESEGLIVHMPRVGTTVRVLDYSEISELYEMRTVLEATAARLAARAASDVELSEIASIQHTMSQAKGTATLRRQNQQFHGAILNAARNRFLVRAVDAIHKTLLILGPTTMEKPQRARDAVTEHVAVLDALAKRDQDGAETAMRCHIEAAHRARLQQLRDQHPPGDRHHDL